MDPYKVLGISRSASEEEIKTAYRELVKKYHPDRYHDNPLADLAEEKLREVNEAYDMLMKPSTTTSSYYGSSTYGTGYDAGQSDSGPTYGAGYNTNYANSGSKNYYDIRAALDRNDLRNAARLLSARRSRDAEWYFLSGVYNYKSGYYDTAMQQIRHAINVDPGNQEYQDVYRRISGTGAIYKTTSTSRGYSSPSCVDCAMCYCLGNTFCC